MIRKAFEFLGFYPKVLVANLKNIGWYLKDYRQFKKGSEGSFSLGRPFPVLFDKNEEASTLSPHYFFQDAWAAKHILNNSPDRHVDIGSRIDGFVSNVATFREIEVIDIRPMKPLLPSIKFIKADIMSEDPGIDKTSSLSSLHVLEHFGLGRYGDPIDPNGHLKGFEAMLNLLSSGGTFYFSTPIGPQRVEFNAHRVFSIKYLLEMFKPNFEVAEFCYVDDEGNFHERVELSQQVVENNADCWYGCGMFKLRKIS